MFDNFWFNGWGDETAPDNEDGKVGVDVTGSFFFKFLLLEGKTVMGAVGGGGITIFWPFLAASCFIFVTVTL